MTHNKKLRRLFVWSAIFAVLVASLAPSITRVAFRQTLPVQAWIEVCTPGGLEHLSAALLENGPDSQTSQGSGSHSGSYFEHCSFCVTQACSFGLIPVTQANSLPLMAAQDHHLFTAHVAPHTRFVWQANRARAPPAFL
ncbi:MAG: DUF2946 domain-containing protein [Azoarcus sp.]|nr:DUF2946 domain-containing protein [Azoarcus sp.]